MTLANAETLSRDSYPYATHIRALEALNAWDTNSIWEWFCERAKSTVADYEAKHGAAPTADMSMKQVEEATRNASLTVSQIAAPKTYGLLGTYLSHGTHKKESD